MPTANWNAGVASVRPRLLLETDRAGAARVRTRGVEAVGRGGTGLEAGLGRALVDVDADARAVRCEAGPPHAPRHVRALAGEKGVRLAQKMQVGPCILVGDWEYG